MVVLSEYLVASFLAAFLIIFSVVNLLNAIATMFHRNRRKGQIELSKVKNPNSLHVAFVILGTFAFFLEVVVYSFCVLLRLPCQLGECDMIIFHFQGSVYLQIFGASLILVGSVLFLWSILVRGRQRNFDKLVTGGPFRYVRHPSYLGYFLMFIGLLLLLANIVSLIPLIAIPGYVGLTEYEEQLLIKRFGDEYIRYQKITGRFIPKLKIHAN